ncbi:DUF885 family protein [Galbibacter sp. EGI 63066]|uniref:DUF885 family protein n=1 Tax=Galbibacter sp. EGI 63066 TaxID=2993559 RepID=UPI002248AE12|nr:DUF885 family protein [Galbibacter sp. EGI 63066]MCX2678632.1 DUF885 family protein [Galbibacter sp. EGI 63066]
MKKKAYTSILVMMIAITGFANDMIDVVNTYQADKRTLKATYTVDESEEYYKRFTAFFKQWRNYIKDIDFKNLSLQEKADYILLENLIEKEDYHLQLSYKAYKEVAHVTDFADKLYVFVQERRHGKRPESASLAKTFTKASDTIDKKMVALKEAAFEDWIQADKAAGVVKSLHKALKEAYDFYFSYDPEFTWWMEQPFKELSEKLTAYGSFLKENYDEGSIKDDGSGIIGKPVGRDAILKELAFEMIPYTPEELIATAEKQFDWCKAEMIKASEEMGYGNDWKAALEHVKETYVPVGEQPQAIKDLFDQSVDFIEERDIITIPDLAKETWRMIMMTPKRQKINPFFTGGWEISISYPTMEMSQEDKLMSMRGNNPNFSRATVQHELLPGHNLEFFMNARHKSYRRPFGTPFWMEGWALYWEIILWDKQFPQTPEQKMGMLFWRIHRCARIIFSLKYQLGEMTPQECIDILVNEVGHEYANAEAEVRRSFATTYTPPLYQLAYMVGGLQFYALRKELLEKGWTEKQFHDRVMKENMMPVEILRAVLEELPLKKNYSTEWKFSTDFK